MSMSKGTERVSPSMERKLRRLLSSIQRIREQMQQLKQMNKDLQRHVRAAKGRP